MITDLIYAGIAVAVVIIVGALAIKLATPYKGTNPPRRVNKRKLSRRDRRRSHHQMFPVVFNDDHIQGTGVNNDISNFFDDHWGGTGLGNGFQSSPYDGMVNPASGEIMVGDFDTRGNIWGCGSWD